MKPVFADTFFFLASVNPADAAHRIASDWIGDYKGPLLTTAWVVTELADAFSASVNRGTFAALYRAMHANPRLEIMPPDPDVFERALNLYFDRPDKHWSLTDCISFTVMTERGLTDAVTGDHHFEQAGFKALLR